MKTRKTFSYSTMNLSMSVCVFDAVSHFDSHAVRFCVLFSSLQILFYNVYGDGASLYLCLCFVCPVLRFVFMITFLRSVRYVCNWYNIWNLLFFCALTLLCCRLWRWGFSVFQDFVLVRHFTKKQAQTLFDLVNVYWCWYCCFCNFFFGEWSVFSLPWIIESLTALYTQKHVT